MLSAKDYALINRWKLLGIPREAVFKGITQALSGESESVRGLSDCCSHVEEVFRESGNDNTFDESEGDSTYKVLITEKINKLTAEILADERREFVRTHYISFRERLDMLSGNHGQDIFELIRSLERQFFDEFFEQLAVEEKQEVIGQAEALVPRQARFISDSERQESLLACRNQVIVSRYNLVNIFDIY